MAWGRLSPVHTAGWKRFSSSPSRLLHRKSGGLDVPGHCLFFAKSSVRFVWMNWDRRGCRLNAASCVPAHLARRERIRALGSLLLDGFRRTTFNRLFDQLDEAAETAFAFRCKPRLVVSRVL